MEKYLELLEKQKDLENQIKKNKRELFISLIDFFINKGCSIYDIKEQGEDNNYFQFTVYLNSKKVDFFHFTLFENEINFLFLYDKKDCSACWKYKTIDFEDFYNKKLKKYFE
jgi:hypothetical protein